MFERKILAIPGPAIFDPSVLRTLGVENLGHLSREFVEVFSEVLKDLRKLLYVDDEYKLVVLAGSGTLAMETAVTNFIMKNEKVLVVSNGYFGDRMVEILNKYPVHVDIVRISNPGEIVENEIIAEKLNKESYSLVAVTHVDTSTGVRHPIDELGRIVRDRDTLLVVDGVCSVGGEKIKMKDWGIDIVLTASQKAVGVPTGLAILWLSPKALTKLEETKGMYAPYYMDLIRWLTVMKSYEDRKPIYFATPAVNLIVGLHRSLELIFSEGIENRFQRHKILSNAVRAALNALNLEILPKKEEYSSSTITAVYLPNNIDLKEFRGEMLRRNVVIAGGLYPGIKDKYFRIGHMGQVNANDAVSIIAAIERSLYKLGYKVELGVGVKALQEVLAKNNM